MDPWVEDPTGALELAELKGGTVHSKLRQKIQVHRESGSTVKGKSRDASSSLTYAPTFDESDRSSETVIGLIPNTQATISTCDCEDTIEVKSEGWKTITEPSAHETDNDEIARLLPNVGRELPIDGPYADPTPGWAECQIVKNGHPHIPSTVIPNSYHSHPTATMQPLYDRPSCIRGLVDCRPGRKRSCDWNGTHCDTLTDHRTNTHGDHTFRHDSVGPWANDETANLEHTKLRVKGGGLQRNEVKPPRFTTVEGDNTHDATGLESMNTHDSGLKASTSNEVNDLRRQNDPCARTSPLGNFVESRSIRRPEVGRSRSNSYRVQLPPIREILGQELQAGVPPTVTRPVYPDVFRPQSM